MTTYTITAETDLESLVSPLDMRAEIAAALKSGDAEVEFGKDQIDGLNTRYVYLPSCGRGGVCDNGQTQWIDCTGLDDLADKWANAADHDWNR